MSGGYVVATAGLDEHRLPGDTAAERTAIDASCGCERLEQRLLRFSPGRSSPRGDDDREEVLYVVSGRGAVKLGGRRYELEPDSGFLVAPGERYEVENERLEDLVVVSVTAPPEVPPTPDDERRLVRFAEQPAEVAGGNREFRVLVGEQVGCPDVTQFVGIIPPGRAPLHHHLYDEVIYVVEGDGVLHLAGRETLVGAGSAIHLPPLVDHCLENTGTGALRVLGVFYPSGSPAEARESGTNEQRVNK